MAAKYKIGDILVYMYTGGRDSEPVEETMVVDHIEQDDDDIRYFELGRFVYEEDVIRVEEPKDLAAHLTNIFIRVHNMGVDSSNGINPHPEALYDIAHELAVMTDNVKKKLYKI